MDPIIYKVKFCDPSGDGYLVKEIEALDEDDLMDILDCYEYDVLHYEEVKNA